MTNDLPSTNCVFHVFKTRTKKYHRLLKSKLISIHSPILRHVKCHRLLRFLRASRSPCRLLRRSRLLCHSLMLYATHLRSDVGAEPVTNQRARPERDRPESARPKRTVSSSEFEPQGPVAAAHPPHVIRLCGCLPEEPPPRIPQLCPPQRRHPPTAPVPASHIGASSSTSARARPPAVRRDVVVACEELP